VRRAGAALAAAALVTGCTYYNTLHNAERLYEDAERHRHAGRDSLAVARYRDVVRKTADAYRGGASGDRIAPTLFLLGRAQLRVGEPAAARLALEEAAAFAREPGLASEIDIYLAMAEARLGEEAVAITRLDGALADSSIGSVARAEARLLRGSLRLSERSAATAWVDLDAAGVTAGVDVEAGLERLASSLRHDERERARAALEALLVTPAAGERFDTIASLLRAASSRWGPREAAGLLARTDTLRWDQPFRGRILLERARLLREAGDTLGALEDAARVASARGEVGAEARLLLAAWHLSVARDLGAAASVRPILLPAEDHARVGGMLEAIGLVERLAGQGLDAPLAWFAAAEVARDRLGSPVLARGFFLAYADIDPLSAWAPKALLAALDVSPDEPDRAWLRGRLEAHRDSPYVLAARGGSPEGFEALEEELDVRLREIRGR
jgi:hypothetical protein